MTEGPILDLSRLNRKVWLVKVPSSVAAAWRPLCDAAMNPSSLEEDAPAIQLGSVRLEPSQEAQKGFEMTLTTAGTGSSQPRAFKLTQLNPVPGSTVLALSYKTDGQADASVDAAGGLFAEGVVDASFNATPILTDDKVDSAYALMNRERTLKAATRLRTVQTYQDTRENNINRLTQSRAANLDTKRKAELDRKARDDIKRVKADADVLERELFGLFERQQNWTMAKLVEETRQAAAHLRTVLDKIAVFNKRGPHRDTYQLKKDYALGGQEPPTG